MFNQRLQILISREQRLRLEEEARRSGGSVASVIRAAVDDRYGVIGEARRAAAVQRIAGMSGPAPSIAEIEAELAGRFDDAVPGGPSDGR